jgi:hypothetical protein
MILPPVVVELGTLLIIYLWLWILITPSKK